MEKIKLNKGLIAIGSSKGEGKTRFSLKLANYIAQNENVLFISYTTYKEKLISNIIEIDGFINEKLDINTSFSYWGTEVFLDIIKYVKTNKISTIFLDDIENFCGYNGNKDDTIKDLKYLSELLDIKLVFSTNLIRLDSIEYSNYEGSMITIVNYKPNLKEFKWSHRLINDCTQIIGLYRPSYNGFTEDADGNSSYDRIEIYYLKNNENENNIYILSNKKENLYN